MKVLTLRMAGFLKQLPRRHQLLLSGVCLATLIVMLLPSEPATASRNTSDPKLADKQLILGERFEIPVKLKDQITAPATSGVQLA